jgi:uncharacterized membrane protein YvbJ
MPHSSLLFKEYHTFYQNSGEAFLQKVLKKDPSKSIEINSYYQKSMGKQIVEIEYTDSQYIVFPLPLSAHDILEMEKKDISKERIKNYSENWFSLLRRTAPMKHKKEIYIAQTYTISQNGTLLLRNQSDFTKETNGPCLTSMAQFIEMMNPK